MNKSKQGGTRYGTCTRAGKAVVAKVDIDEEQELATQYGIESIPTVILFKDGKPINVEVGAHQKDFYANLIDMHL